MELSVLNIFRFCLIFCSLSVIADDVYSNLHYFETLKKVDINRRVRRSTDPHPSSHLHEIWFTALGRNFHLYVKQKKVVSDDFVATFVGSDGIKAPLDIDTWNFYTGTLKDDPSSNVQLHWEGSDLHATINYPEDVVYVEPSWRHISGSDNHSMIVYKHSDLKWKPEEFSAGKRESFCEMKDLRNTNNERLDDEVKLFHRDDSVYSRKKRQVYPHVGTHTMCNLFVVADYYFFENIGNKDKRVTGEYLIGMIGRVNDIYTKTDWGEGVSGLGFEIKEMLINGQYNEKPGDHYNMANRPADMDAVLDWFGDDSKKLTQFCLGHLFTYQRFPGKLGLAYIGSWRFTDPGGICSFPAYVSAGKKIAVNTGVSTFQNPGGSRALAAQATITVSHELGHNWGSEHDPDSDECAPPSTQNGKYIMFYRATSGFEANNQVFSPCSKRFIFKVVMKKGYDCFAEKTAGGRGVCGNGRLDPGEDCDAGYEGDFCCNNDCTLRSGAKCSNMNYACCMNCNTAPAGTRCYEPGDLDCLGYSNCTGHSFTCPDPVKKSGINCHDDGICVNGVCKDVCEAEGKTSCLCAGTDSCKKCCLDQSGRCSAVTKQGSYVYHADGRPCNDGFCDGKGNCVESDPPIIKRLFSILDYFSVDKIAKAMKNNLVWIILVLSSILWIIGIVIIERYDRKKFAEDKPVVEAMDPRGEGGRRVNFRRSQVEDETIEFIGTRRLRQERPRMRGQRGRAVLDEELAAEAGFITG